MTSTSTPFALFAVAAGAGVGLGRLARAGALADALGVDRHLVLRGPEPAIETAVRLGWTVHVGSSVLEYLLPDVLIVDDGTAADVARWVRRARRLQVPVVTSHYGRRISTGADLTVDGGFVPYEDTNARLSGPEFAVLDWRVAARRLAEDARDSRRVLIALGATASARRLAAAIATGLTDSVPSLRVDVAAGMSPADDLPAMPASGRWVLAPHGLVPLMASAAVVVTSGGMALYESCALGSPTVAAALSDSEARAVTSAARAGAVVQAGASGVRLTPDAVVRAVVDLLADPSAAKDLGRQARQLVDGRGASRVADAVRHLLATSHTSGWSHAA